VTALLVVAALYSAGIGLIVLGLIARQVLRRVTGRSA
jgi:hypothetical protein